jgi:hypothetical protein
MNEKKNGALTFPAEENHRLTVMNSQRSSNPIEPIKITIADKFASQHIKGLAAMVREILKTRS